MANDTITVSTTTKTESQGVNGGLSVGDALAKFYNVSLREVEGKLVGQMVRLNNSTVNVPGDLAQPLRGGDSIVVFPNDIARGGVKGASAQE